MGQASYVFLPAIVCLAAGVFLVVVGVRGMVRMRRGTAARTAAVCRLIAGIGALVGAVVCALMVFVDIPYAVIVFPMVASVVTALWIVGWVIAASIHDMRAARSVGP